ncbi:MAG TPA: hypothetical protein VMV17_11200 [Streptosporangiaceae bacterium]|nr:hypothetical protein [Streptosporangiaceae bacterium]
MTDTKGNIEPDLELRDYENVPLPVGQVAFEADPTARLASPEYVAQLGRTSALRGLIRRQLDYLAEHRQALVTAAVTGELDVASGRAGAEADVGG